MITKNSTNQEIRDAFKDVVATGKAFVYGLFETANADYIQLGIAQEVTTPGSATAEQQLFLGWGENKSIVRCLQNVKKEVLENIKKYFNSDLNPGSILDKANIQITEAFTPNSWPDADGTIVYQKAKVYPESSQHAGKFMVDSEGRRVYRNTSLVLGEATHTFVKDCVPEAAPANAVSLESLATA